jgi:sugar lactone lactonase YvrE
MIRTRVLTGDGDGKCHLGRHRMRPRNLLVLGWLALIGLMAPGAAGQVLEEGDIVVSDRGAGSVIRIRPGGSPEPTLIESGFSSLRGILADDFGSVFLTESVSDHVLHLDPDTGVIGIVAGPPYASVFAVPEEIVFDEFGDLLVADASLTVWGPGVVRLDPVVGDPEIVYPEPMAPQGDFTLGFPEGLALDLGSETLYVTDTTTAEPGVYKIDLALPLEDRTLEPVSLHGGFVTPKDVALEPGGTLLVADRFAGPNYETGIVFRVDPTVAPDPEAPLGGNQSIVVENLQAPVGLHVYPSGDFLVADFGAGAILRYDENGVYQPGGSYSGDPLVGPWRITVVGPLTSRGDFLVADTEQQPEPELYRLSFDPADPAAATRTEEPHVMSFEAPAGVAVDTDGTPLVCDGDETTQDQSLFRVTR